MTIKGCPFCGHGPKIDCLMKNTSLECYFIKCTNPNCEVEIRHPYKTEQEALVAWNTRVGNDAPISEPIRTAEYVGKRPVDTVALDSVYHEVVEKFGEKALWSVIFLIQLIDVKTWTFPDYVHGGPFEDLVQFIEGHEGLKRMFQVTE